MKKLMFIIAAVLAVGMSQGATVSWKISNARAPVAPDGLTIGSGNSKIATTDTALVMNLYIQYLDESETKKELLLGNVALTDAGAKGSSQLWDQATAMDYRTNKNNGTAGYVNLILEATYEDAGYNYAISLTQTADLRSIESANQTVTFNFANQT